MKIALVTGGSRGIGKAISVRLGQEGYHVLVNYRSRHSEAMDTLEKVRSVGGEGALLQFDVSDPVAVKRVLDQWHEANPEKQITILVNNAGVSRDNLMVFMADEEWKDVMKTNLDSFFYVTRYLLQNMLVGKWGRIVNIVSLSGQKGLPGQVNYSASKGAVIAATKSLAMEIGKKKVTVNAVAPGFIRTEMTAGLDEKQLSALVPLRRFGEPEEVASAVSFLISEGASYITGETISVNGGMYS
jgi:3-oxoacyl-[acyl-carrier protein] reductase